MQTLEILHSCSAFQVPILSCPQAPFGKWPHAAVGKMQADERKPYGDRVRSLTTAADQAFVL